MPLSLFEKHKDLLDNAVNAIATRGYWSAYAEMPSPKIYGENAADDGIKAFDARLNKKFEIDQPAIQGWYDKEVSPYGKDLNVQYPMSDGQALVDAALAAMPQWRDIGAKGRVGICMEILERLNQHSFEMAQAVMLTSGQGWMMAFQAGAAHAQERGLEAVAYAWREMSFIPDKAIWEKPQGKRPPLKMEKNFKVVGRGVGVIIGCATFPTWNTYPGLFATLATGNPAILKPHSQVVMPAALTVKIAREVLQEHGLDPNIISLFVNPDRKAAQALFQHKDVHSIDYTGSNGFGNWLVDNCRQASVYAELAGVNSIFIESTDNYEGMLRNLAFTLSLYSGQMCTTSQALIIPANGIETNDGHKSYEQVGQDLAKAIEAFLAKPEVAQAVLGAIQSDDTYQRVLDASAGKMGEVVLASKKLEYPDFPKARAQTPVLLSADAKDAEHFAQEQFGPISFVIKVADAQAGIQLVEDLTREHGALTVSVYSTDDKIIEQVIQATWRSKVALSINLTGGVFVNQSAAFSDFHGTGGNPAANASYADSAFVANRFRVVQRRRDI